jgi:TfoX/Sxy family transcriptional regulator of competence genes
MAYDKNLASRIKAVLGDHSGFTSKKMFGGVGYLLNGNMACGVHKDFLIVRVGPDRYQEALDQAHTKMFDITGRPMTGWVMVEPEGCVTEDNLRDWVQKGVNFASTLPAK